MPRLPNISKYCRSWRSGRLRLVEGVEHAGALDRRLLHAVDHRRLGQAGRLEDRRCDVDDVRELRPHPARLLDARRASARSCRCGCRPSATRPAWSTATACSSPRPSRPSSGCRSRRPELVHLADHELGRLEGGHAVEVGHLVEGAVHGAFGRRAVVADDVVDDRVVEDAEVVEASISRPTWWSVCSRKPAYTSICRASTGLSSSGMSSHAGDLVVPRRQLGVGGDDAELLLPGEGALALDVPAVVELAGVLVGPLLWDVVRCVRGTRVRSRRRTACRASAPSAGGSSRSRGRSGPR